MNRKFFTFFAIVIATILLPMEAMARTPMRYPSPLRTTRWYSVRISLEPEPVMMTVVQPCPYPGSRLGFTILGGTLSQTNMNMPFGPTLSSSLELCLARYSYANWAPTRIALDVFVGTSNFENQWFTNLGLGTRYQFPLVEKFDLGLYWKYSFTSNFLERTENRHGLTAGMLAELRPLYSGQEKNASSGLFFTVRAGLGVESHNRTNSVGWIAEFLLGAGYRFADF